MYAIVEKKGWYSDKFYISLHSSEERAEKIAKKLNKGDEGIFWVVNVGRYNINRRMKYVYLD